MNTKNNSRSRETRERLKEALLRLLARRDILDVTVSRLCQEAGVNRSTFYSHYDSIGDLMEEMEQEIGANLIGRFREDNYDGEHPFSPGHLLPILEHIRDNRDFTGSTSAKARPSTAWTGLSASFWSGMCGPCCGGSP